MGSEVLVYYAVRAGGPECALTAFDALLQGHGMRRTHVLKTVDSEEIGPDDELWPLVRTTLHRAKLHGEHFKMYYSQQDPASFQPGVEV